MTTIAGHTTRANGTILTAAIYNADHVNHVTNAQALNNTKMEGATPPVADGHAVVWNGTSGNLLRTAGFAPVSSTVYAADLAATNATLALKAPLASPVLTGVATAADLTMRARSGSDGGRLVLEKPASGTTLTGNVHEDINADKLRFYDNAGTNKGAFLDLAGLAAGIGSKIFTDVDIASLAQAQAGTDNTKLMTPLRVAQEITALATAINIGSQLSIGTSGVDMGVDDAGLGAAFIASWNSSLQLLLSGDGGTNYSIIFTGISSGSIIFVRNGIAVSLSMQQGGTPSIQVTRDVLTAGAGNIFIKTSASTAQVIRIM
jgi:hypothetical protein